MGRYTVAMNFVTNSIELPRLYEGIMRDHLATERQMIFLSGPRQVGKTTLGKLLGSVYLNWDNATHRRVILKGPEAVADAAGLTALQADLPVVVFDEIHKHPKWKNFLKGFFDTYEDRVRVIVTGSARMDVFRRGGDSLMGRYFLYRMHPLSVAECLSTEPPGKRILREPRPISEDNWLALCKHGGFPEPFRRRSSTFSSRWRRLRQDLLLREDTRDVARIEDIGVLETFGHILADQSGQQLVLSQLAGEVGVSVDTVRRWLDLLERLYFGFRVRPWFRNVRRSLRKEPKWFLRDWSGITDAGARAETMIACHLLKAVEGWTDLGLGEFELRYLRDKEKREVDFAVIRNGKPWFLVEVKSGSEKLSQSLALMQEATGASHAFQCVLELPFVDADCFSTSRPTIVPARTLLSQFV
jgi:predicted AAA+ superfamily ATPase